ncbi:MAG: 50S ribosomal protein L1 [Solirubrobacterales bacterium]
MAHGKRYRMQREKVQGGQLYPPAEAMNLIAQTASAGFDESVELHVRLGVNVKHAEEQLRGTLALPHGLGRDVRVAVFAQGDKARDAEAAGADIVGGEDLAAKIEEGFDEFDVVIAAPDQMPVVGRLGRILGPSGKMPNPKVGTVTEDIEKAVGETKSGKVEYRTDRQAIVHMVIGKASFDPQRLLDNYAAVMDEITRAKPSAAKGRYVISVSVSTTMGPGIPIDPTLTTEGEILGGAPVGSNGSSSEAQADQPAAEAEEVEVEESEPVAEEVEVEEVEEPEPAAEEAEATDDDDEASAPESEEVGDEDSVEGSDEDQEA